MPPPLEALFALNATLTRMGSLAPEFAMPPPKPEVVEERAKWIFGKLNSYGVTGIVTAQLDQVRLKAYRDLESKNELTVRIQGSWHFNTRYVPTTLDEQ